LSVPRASTSGWPSRVLCGTCSAPNAFLPLFFAGKKEVNEAIIGPSYIHTVPKMCDTTTTAAPPKKDEEEDAAAIMRPAERGQYYIYEGSDSEPEEVSEEYFAAAAAGKKQDNEPRCVSCGVALGYSNPRQYCRKTYCPDMRYDYAEEDEEEDIGSSSGGKK
jgi:hypothetical protein